MIKGRGRWALALVGLELAVGAGAVAVGLDQFRPAHADSAKPEPAAMVQTNPADVERALQAKVDKAVARVELGRDCLRPVAWPESRGVPAHVIVKVAGSTKVRIEGFDAAWADARAGRVWIVALCAR
jgi:hypothetical protein